MNELLGWYGYENVDRSDLGKSSKQPSNAKAQQANNNQIRLIKTPTTVNLSLRSEKITTTPSTPDRLINNSSPESSSRYSKSPGTLVSSRSELVIDEKKGKYTNTSHLKLDIYTKYILTTCSMKG